MSEAREPRIAVELARVAVAAIGIAAPFALGLLAGDRSHDVPLEPRYAWVIGAASLGVLAVLAESTSSRGRKVCAGLVLVPLLHALAPGAPALAALDASLVLIGAAAVAGRAGRRIGRMPRSRPTRIASIALLVLSVAGPHVTLAWGLASTVIAPALIRIPHSFPEIGPGERAVALPSRDGVVLRGTFAEGPPGAPSILLVHGVGDSRRRLVPWARELAARGASVLRIDLRAHGVSDGAVVTFADREPDDVEAALAFLAAQPGAGPLHVLGVSMGGGATLAAVSRPSVHVASTVALAPASDYRPLVERRLPSIEPLHGIATALVGGVTHGLGHRSPLELVPADAVVARGPARILVVHSRSDATVPASVTEALALRAPWIEVAWLDGVHHNDTPAHTLDAPALRDRIARFLGVP